MGVLFKAQFAVAEDDSAPANRLFGWLDNMNTIASLRDGTIPMRTLLYNAVHISNESAESTELEKFLNRVGRR